MEYDMEFIDCKSESKSEGEDDYTDELLKCFQIMDINSRQRFKDHKIDSTLFDFLGEDINILLPTIRERALFRKGIADYKAKNAVDSANAPTSTNITELSSASSADSLLNFDIEKLLSQSTRGMFILKYYNTNSILSSDTRSKLVDIIADEVFRVGIQKGNATIKVLAQKISSLFPNEPEKIYYISPKTEGPNQTHSKGVLVNKFRNYNRTSAKEKMFKSATMYEFDEIVQDYDDNDDDTMWLKVNNGPWEEICNRWLRTVSSRKKSFAGKTTEEILSTWPVLKTPRAFQLISIDFSHQFPDKDLLLHQNWKSFTVKFQHILRKKLKKPAHKELLYTISTDTVDENTEVLVLMRFLTILMPATQKVKQTANTLSKKEHWSPNSEESFRGFILESKSEADILLDIRNLNEFKKSYGLTVQPHIVRVTDSELEKYYIFIENQKYIYDSLLSAVDNLFKAFFALDLSYNFECSHIFEFLQKYFYNISTTYDKNNKHVLSLISELNSVAI